MQWITENDLAKWAKMLDSRSYLISMVADLIRASIPFSERMHFRFPCGDSSQIRGWDGDLSAPTAIGYIPEGRSKWEFGGGGSGSAKASSDYQKRTDQTDAAIMAENTLVLVNLNVWDTPKEKITDWEDARRKEGKWRDVKYIDGIQLVHWLKEHPAVAAKYARDVLQNAPKEGALSIDEYWDEFSLQYRPQLHEDAVIAGRVKQKQELLEKLHGPAGSIMLRAESAEEIVAFAVAVIRQSETEPHNLLKNKTLIVSTEAAARSLLAHDNLVLILKDQAEKLAGRLGQKFPTLSAVTGPSARDVWKLDRPTAQAMAEGFCKMELDSERAYDLAHKCGRSIQILKRLIPSGPVPQPEWHHLAAVLKPVFLAGSWSSKVVQDIEILKVLTGFESEEQLENLLYPTRSMSEQPIDSVDGVWQVRAPVDAFHYYGRMLTTQDLQRLKVAIIKVFSSNPDAPSEEEEFTFSYRDPKDFSSWLKDGLALTLIIIVTMHESAGLTIKGQSAQQYVDEIISNLPDWGKSHHSITRLASQTALIAEAAPNPFLTALESILEGPDSDISKLFNKDENLLFGPSSPHTNILWAIETIAWDPTFINRAVIILAKLAIHDPTPNSNHVNRPLNSLRHILLGWAPNTYALQFQRVECVDLVIETSRDIGWSLLLSLLPRGRDMSMRTQHPKIRDLAPRVRERITFGSVWKFESEIVDRVLAITGNEEDKITALIQHYGKLQPSNRIKLLSFFDNYLQANQTELGNKIWHDLKEEAARNSFFAESDWALKADELKLIQDIVDKHRPSNPLASERQLFDEWMPHIGRYKSEDSENPDEMRVNVLQTILERDGIAGILKLAQSAKLPRLVGSTLYNIDISEDQLLKLFEDALDSSTSIEFILSTVGVGAVKFKKPWMRLVISKHFPIISDLELKTKVLFYWSQNESFLEILGQLDEELQEKYWLGVQELPLQGSLDNLVYALEQFIRNSRALDAICFLRDRIKELPSKLLGKLLTDGAIQLAQSPQAHSSLCSYYVEKAIKELQEREDVSEQEIVIIEFTYLSMLQFDNEPPAIINYMAKTPLFFVEVLSKVYKGRHENSDHTLSDEQRLISRTSYRLLRKFKKIPGNREGSINASELSNWLSEVRRLAADKGLLEIADGYIGGILAHAPHDAMDKLWPPSEICEVIESVVSKELADGFVLECLNKRGVYSKAVGEGGDQERELAEKYRSWSESNQEYPRTSSILDAVAQSWLEHALQEDTKAEHRKMKR